MSKNELIPVGVSHGSQRDYIDSLKRGQGNREREERRQLEEFLEKIEEAMVALLDDLSALPTSAGRVVLDELDLDLYRQALKGVRSLQDIEAVRVEVRRSCEFRPTAKRLREIKDEVVSDGKSVTLGIGPAQAAAYKLYKPDAGTEQRWIAGRTAVDAINGIRRGIKEGIARDGEWPSQGEKS